MNLATILRFIVRHPLNRSHRARAIGRFLRWQLASRLLPYPISLPFVDGLSLFAERGMTGATGNYYCGLHEAEDMAFVLHFMRPGDVFYDIGANVGSYSLLAAAAGVGRIIGFEPSTETSAKYRRNIALNGLERVIEHQRVALGANDGELSFTRGHDTTNHVVAENERPVASETVPVRRFDEFFAARVPSFVKMDVEGFEAQVLAGASSALKDPSLMGLLVEDNGSDHRYGTGGSVSELLVAHGFAVFGYDLATRTLTSGRKERATGNLLFLRNFETASERVRGSRKFQLINGWI
jgi:FkbM family methyltransferase